MKRLTSKLVNKDTTFCCYVIGSKVKISHSNKFIGINYQTCGKPVTTVKYQYRGKCYHHVDSNFPNYRGSKKGTNEAAFLESLLYPGLFFKKRKEKYKKYKNLRKKFIMPKSIKRRKWTNG